MHLLAIGAVSPHCFYQRQVSCRKTDDKFRILWHVKISGTFTFKLLIAPLTLTTKCLHVGTWSRGCRPTEWLGGRKSSWLQPPAPHHRVHGVSSAGWSPPVFAADVCPRHTACVPAGGPLQGACWGPPECSGWWCPFLWCLDVRWWPYRPTKWVVRDQYFAELRFLHCRVVVNIKQETRIK